jgi:hypothetical protein
MIENDSVFLSYKEYDYKMGKYFLPFIMKVLCDDAKVSLIGNFMNEWIMVGICLGFFRGFYAFSVIYGSRKY